MDPIDIRLLFRWIDTSDNYINQEFASFLTSSEFGSVLKNVNNIFIFLSLSVVIKKNDIDVQQLFRNYDVNDSGTLDQIREIIKVLLPKFSNNHLSLIIDHINKKFNGNLPIQTLYYKLRCLGDELDEKNNVIELSFKNQFKFEITTSQIVKNFDKNKNDKLDFTEFKKMVFSIGNFVRKLKMMFDKVDKDHSGQISIGELKFFENKSITIVNFVLYSNYLLLLYSLDFLSGLKLLNYSLL
eukprot:284814777_3